MAEGISIVVCTYNGEAVLEETFKHLFAQQHIDFPVEIVVVDNNSKDGTPQLIQTAKKASPFPFIYLTETRQGKAHASRSAFDTASHPIILVCDDDNRLAPDYVSRGHMVMQQHPNVGIIGGSGEPESTVPMPPWFKDYERIYAVGNQCHANGIVTDQVDFIWGAGMFFRKSVWESIRNYDPTFHLNARRGKVNIGGDDAELCELARWCGYDIYVSNELRFKHRIPANRLTLAFLRSRHKGLGATSLILQMYEMVRNDHTAWALEKGKFPFWMHRSFHLVKDLFKYLPDLPKWLAGKAMDSRLSFLGDLSRIRFLLKIKGEYQVILTDLIKKHQELSSRSIVR